MKKRTARKLEGTLVLAIGARSSRMLSSHKLRGGRGRGKE